MKPVRSGGLDPDVVARLEELRDGRAAPRNSEEIRDVVEGILSTLSGDLTGGDVKVFAEIESLASYIRKTKAEIANIRPEEISDHHIVSATDELDAIVAATEDATNGIMEATEMMEGLVDKLDEQAAQTIMDATTKIYEACSFQDITGQRVSKVVSALKEIETKVEAILEMFGFDDEKRAAANRRRQEAKAEEDAEMQAGDIDEDKLLEGPQLPSNANSQDDIDALFASLK